MRSLRSNIAAVVTSSLVLTGAIVPSRVAAADGDQYAEQATITYRLDRKDKEVDVRASFAITNRIPSTPTARYYTDRWQWIYVPTYAQDFRVISGGKARLVKRDAQWRYYEISFARIFYGQHASFTATWTLPSRGAKSSNPTRVTDAYSHFCWYGQDVDAGSTRAILPRRVDVETSGSDVRTSKGKVTTVVGRQRTDLNTFGACTDVYDGRLLVHRMSTSPAGHQVEIGAWPDDTAWLDTAEQNVDFALSKLEGIVGAPIPGDKPIVVREAAANALGGYAGDFDSDSSVIRLNEQDDSTLTITHEIAHSWFNTDSFASTWMYEGLAEWAARSAIGVPCSEPPDYPGKGSPNLTKWRRLGYKPSQTTRDVLGYQYEASCAIMATVADAIGPDRMNGVIEVLLDGRSPYDRLPSDETQPDNASSSASPASGSFQPDGSPAASTPVGATDPSAGWTPTRSQKRRTKPVDWRQWLDVVDEVGLVPAGVTDLTIAEDALVHHGIATPKKLQERAAARTAFHELQTLAPGGQTPAVVRRLLDDWQFEQALTAIGAAQPVAASLSSAAAEGGNVETQWKAYEAARTVADINALR